MKSPSFSNISIVMAFSAVLCYNQASAQSPVARSAAPIASPVAGISGGVAVLDVNYVFQRHPRFKKMMVEMKADVDRADGLVKAEREDIQRVYAKLGQLKGSPEYKQMEEEMAKRENDLNLKINLTRKEFMQREAKIYFSVYQEIQQEVDYYCKQNGIDIVMQFNGDAVDAENPQSVLKAMSKPILYYAQQRDITPVILQALGGSTDRTNPVTPGMAGRTTVPANPYRK